MSTEQDESVLGVVSAFVRDADRMAVVTAEFLDRLGPSLQIDQSSWPAVFLLELGAVLRLRQWEMAGIKDAIDHTLPSSQEALADLIGRLQTDPTQFIREDAPLLQRVLNAWWFHCAHPSEHFLNVDVVLSRGERQHFVSCVARLLWNLRNIDVPA